MASLFHKAEDKLTVNSETIDKLKLFCYLQGAGYGEDESECEVKRLKEEVIVWLS